MTAKKTISLKKLLGFIRTFIRLQLAGGPKTKAELGLLYNRITVPLSKEDWVETEEGRKKLARHYEVFQQALGQLIEKGHVVCEDGIHYQLNLELEEDLTPPEEKAVEQAAGQENLGQEPPDEN